MTDYQFRVEMTHGQDIRIVDADQMVPQDGWIVFYRSKPQGGPKVEYWRARTDCIVSIETKKDKP